MVQKKCRLCGSKLVLYIKNYFDDRHGSPGKFSIYVCSKCGLGKTYPELKPHQVQKLYTNYYPRQNLNINQIKLEDYKIPPRDVLTSKGLLMNAHLHAKRGSTVLDVGSGVGYSLLELKNMGCKPFGLDPDLNAKKLAAKYKIPFHLGFIEDNPFPSQKFDYITASQVLEHTLDPVKFLKLCAQKLHPKGQIILSFPNFSSLSRRVLGKKYLHWHLPYHQNFFSEKTLLPLAQKAGLEIVDVKTYTPNLWTNLQIRHLLNTQKYKVRDGFWDGVATTSLKGSLAGHLLQKGFHILESNNPLNRMLDSLKMGDSYLLVLKLP